MPVMQQPEAYLGHVSDDSFDDDGCLKDGPLKEWSTSWPTPSPTGSTMIHPMRTTRLLAPSRAGLELRQRHALLAHIFAGAVGVADLAAAHCP